MSRYYLPSVVLFAALIFCTGLASAATPAVISASAPHTLDARPWPRQYTVNNTQFSLYRPQLESWNGNSLQARAVMAVKTGTTTDASGKAVDQQTYGVVWLKARTEIDKVARQVNLDDITVVKTSFPAAKAQEQAYLGLVQSVAGGTALVASLDQMEAALAVADTAQHTPMVQVNNTPPDIIFSFAPAVLVPIDGAPAWRSAGVAGVEKAINTRALLLRYRGRYYLGYGSHWASAPALDAAWAAAPSVAAPLQQVMQAAESANQAPSEKQVAADIADTFKSGKFPNVYVRTHPSELIFVSGQPQFSAVAGTQLSFISNSSADVFVNNAGDHAWYVLVSGRWFSAPSSSGPWHYVAPGALPADFSKIPADNPKSAVLASVAGTPEAKEAVIANSIPQTATVDRSKTAFQARYDGAPQFRPIAGTKDLSYAFNSATPIINVPGHSYYALDNGVWFVSEASPQGPWAVANAVPAAIYSIPSSSPLHYVTYVQVYGGSGNDVYVGYTPGYYGTVVSNGVVVYGTGYPCNSWVGASWYGCPATYGYGAALAFGAAVGWAVAFGWGYYDPWYNPWWGPWAGGYPGYYGWGGAAAWNVYGRWGNSVVGGRAAAWANPWTGNYGRAGAGGFYNPYTGGRGYGYAGRNVNAYTGMATGVAGGVRYNPETGRAVAGRGGAVGNIYTGNGAAAGARTVVNENTGRVTREAGGVARGPGGATASGAFNTSGAGGNARGAGYINYDRATGQVNKGGVVDVNGNIYAGRDGNVYRHDAGGGWDKAGADNRFAPTAQHDASLDRDRMAQDRGAARERASGGFSGGGMRGGGMRGGGGFRRR